MSLVRVWRRQLYGASSAALIVPAAMFASLVALALGGGFSQVGVLGQIFAGPPAPSMGAAAGQHGPTATRLATGGLPAIQATAGLRAGRGSPRSGAGGSGIVRGGGGPQSAGGPSRAGGAVGGAAPIVTQGAGGAAPRPSPAPAGSASPSSSAPSQPQPQPNPRPTPADQIVSAVTPVTQQVPAPVGPAATQVVQAAGSAVDSLLAPGRSAGAPLPQGPGAP